MKDEFLSIPNLPSNSVTEVIVSCSDKSLIDKLSDLGISCVVLSENADLDISVSSHADILTYHLGNGEFITDKNVEKSLKDYLSVKSVNVFSPYPKDCLLNAADIGDFVICNTKITDKLIIESAIKYGKTIINVNQGYAKCSVCVVKRNVIITDDESIYRETAKTGRITPLFVSKGSVMLNGQNYGFLGGASGLIGKDELFFNGDLSSHKDFVAIKEFLDYHNVKYIDIKDKSLTDVGSIIPIKQKGS